ncbi:MAG: carboxypeptidase regulatory-like domain-containing protein, partial [Acidobacteriaceae bacterium]|nr:carboxypeptidase regulatory-like domain-containing protein [Acidobacteriaceae bacterium]
MQRKLCSLAVLFAFSTLPGLAQEVSASITGRVTDPSGASITNATVTAKDKDRGTDWPTKTNVDGIYLLPRVPVGNYEIRVEAPGFKTYIDANVVLELNQRARIDVPMQVGAVNESVSVTADSAVLQTDTTQVGAVINSNTIVNTPLVSRNPVALTLLVAGVTTPDPSSFNNGTRTGGGGRPYVNGNREEGNNFLLDGVDNNQPSDNLTAYQPNLDAIEEFKLITNNASAEFGNFQGGIINVVIKSGTNQFHGNAFEDFRNDVLNADNWARNWQGLSRPPVRWNQFGGTFGGPIFKDKLFFFTDYQGLRQATPTSLASTSVMPAAWRTGDFSSLLTGSKPVQLYNPYALNTATGLRAPFPNNMIPASLIDPAMSKLLNNPSLYPFPTSSALTNNYNYSNASYINTDQGDIKLDYRPSEKDYFSARYSHGRQDQPSVNSFPLFYNGFNVSPFQNGVVNWTRTFSPTLVNEARIGVNDIMLKSGGADKGLGNIAQSVGIQNAGAGLMSLQGLAYAANLGNANVGIQSLFADTTYHYADNVTIVRGRHTMKTGGQFLRLDINTFYSGNNGRTGYFDFTGRFTAQNAASPAGTQIGEADLLLGLPADLGRGLSNGSTWGHRGNIEGLYFQDDWRVNNNLTLNLGLRWEY